VAGSGRLAGRVAVVTGGGKGIGAVYCRALCGEGALVAAADIDGEAAAAHAEKLRAEGAQALGLRVDVSDQASVAAMVDEAVRQFGRLDILVNNAALYTALLPKRPFWERDPAEWDAVLQVNVKGLYLCVHAAFPYLKESGHGRIINISSGTVFLGTTGFLHYVTSKAAVVGFTRALAREVGEFNITVNALAPGLTASETALTKQTMDELEAPLQVRAIKRVQAPDDLVGTLLFLASDDSAFVTGQTLLVDGGAGMH
jgi:3-oxoacyl-[acyl-carrier protein] reductase